MHALKGVVILMGILIAVLMTLMAYGLYQKSQNPDFTFLNITSSDKASPEVIPQAPISGEPQMTLTAKASFGDITLNLPKGAVIVSATPSGTQLIVITARDGTHADQVWVLDMNTGKVLGRVLTGP